MKHKHAELMLQYAQDAMETSEPWERWEFYDDNSRIWIALTSNTLWYEDTQYRRKPKMVSVTLANGDVVSWPEPHKGDLDCNDHYFTVGDGGGIAHYSFQNTSIERKILRFGLAHLTKEAAEQHSYALFKINNQVAK